MKFFVKYNLKDYSFVKRGCETWLLTTKTRENIEAA